MSQGPLVKINDELVVNWFTITRVHRVTENEKRAANDVNFNEAGVGDVVIKFSDGGGVIVKKADGADDFMAYMHDISDTLARRKASATEAAEAADAQDNREFGDRFVDPASA